jgi:hypothetical protein
MTRILPLLAGMLLVAGCSGAGTPADNVAATEDSAGALPEGNALPPPDFETVPPSETALPTDSWIGKWIGPEGLVLDIQPQDDPGRYAITITLLDGTEKHEGTAEGDRISFNRNGTTETIRAATGDETGLKYLAGKQDCLMIKQAEGFCRD